MFWEQQHYRTTLRRVIVTLLIIAAVVFALVYLARAFTWEGELDPNAFDKWSVINVLPNPSGILWVIVRNPDEKSPIKTVALLIDLNMNLLGYRYFKNGEPYGFVFDIAQEKYVRHQYTAEQLKRCMQCHRDHARPEDMAIQVQVVVPPGKAFFTAFPIGWAERQP